MNVRTVLLAAAVSTAASPAMAAASPVTGLSLAASAGVALVGLVTLAVGLSRLAAGSSAPGVRFGALGALGRLGGRGEGEGGIRRAASSIMVGVALLGLPDMFGIGVVSQVRTAYEQAHAAPGGFVTGSDIVPQGPTRTYSGGGGSGAVRTGGGSFPWWMLGAAALILLLGAAARAAAGSRTAAAVAGSPARRRGEGPHADANGAADSFDRDLLPAPESGGVEAGAPAPKTAFEILFDLLERLRERIRILLRNAREQLRRLADEKEEQKGRLRPLAAFAVQQISMLLRVLGDRDDGGSGLPPATDVPDPRIEEDRANAAAFAERIGSALSLQGADLPAQIAKALDTPRRQVEADLARLGASGPPPAQWLRVGCSGPGRPWTLLERHGRPEERRFEGILRMDQVDWFTTLSVERRPSNIGMIVLPAPGCRVHLVCVHDERAEALAEAARHSVRLPEGGSWTLADLPLADVVAHFGEGSDDRWTVEDGGPDDDILAFDLHPRRIAVVSGADRLRRALASEEDPVRALIHVRRGAALASLGVDVDAVVPQD